MQTLVLEVGHVRGFLVIMKECEASHLGEYVPALIDASVVEPSFWLWKSGGWVKQPKVVEVRTEESFNEKRLRVRYGKIKDQDEYNRAHMMVSGHSSFMNSGRQFEGGPVGLLEKLRRAVASLNAYELRLRQESKAEPWYKRLWEFLTSDPDWDRMTLEWSIVLVTIPDRIAFELDRSKAVVPGVFRSQGSPQ